MEKNGALFTNVIYTNLCEPQSAMSVEQRLE